MREEILEAMVNAGTVDTVLTVFPDLYGRLMGKRVTGRFFLDHVRAEGIHACDYLLAVDVDMNPLPGYRFASWDQGYGDVHAVPDMSTLRLVPWLEATAVVICDVFDESDGSPVEVSPRRILQRQVERAADLGLDVDIGAELEFFLFRDSYEEAAAKGYRGLVPHALYNEDYHVLQTTKDEYLIRQIRNGMQEAEIPVEFSKGEAAPGQHEINLRYARAVEMADRHVLYKNGVKEIAALNERSITFMAKWSMGEVGSSCHLHSSVRPGDEQTGRYWLGGLLATARPLALCFAPYVNSYKRYQTGSWAPTAIVWGRDNRTCGFRVVSGRVESRVPGADVNPYVAYAALIAGGLHGIEERIEPPAEFVGNAYEAAGVERIPSTLSEAIGEFEASTLARAAFGDAVHEHLINTARQEWLASTQVVTDWELRRGFERL